MSEPNCRGSIALGSACMKCPRCKEEYDKKVMAVNDAVLKKHDKLFMKLRIAELEEREAKLVSVLKKVNIPCNHKYSGDCDGCNSEILIWETLRELGLAEEAE